MYVNKCTKCGAEFETKNPKRVICPNCLYPEKKLEGESGTVVDGEEQKNYTRSYSAGDDTGYQRKPYQQNPNRENRNGYNNNNDRGGYRQNNNRQQGGFNNRRPNNNYQRQQGGNNRPQQNRFNKQQGGRGGGFNNRRPQKRPMQQKQLLISKEQLAQIEILYKKVLPLPNPDIHEVIGQALGIEPRKVFFGINLIRQKMFLPKLPFPKRKLAVSAEQLSAIKMLYEPLLPLPPIGCHKIIAVQLKMDEWRVHVGIGIVRKQMGLDRWNEGRPDAPAGSVPAASEKNAEPKEEKKTTKRTRKTKTAEEAQPTETPAVEEDAPKKRGRKKKADTAEEK